MAIKYRHGTTDIAKLLTNGDVVPVTDICALFDTRPDLYKMKYRIGGYVARIRRWNGGAIRTFKNGKKVVGYQLVNHYEFDDNGLPLPADLRANARNAYLASVASSFFPNSTDDLLVEGQGFKLPGVVEKRPYVSMADPTNMPLYLPEKGASAPAPETVSDTLVYDNVSDEEDEEVVVTDHGVTADGEDVIISADDQGETAPEVVSEPMGTEDTRKRDAKGHFTKRAA